MKLYKNSITTMKINGCRDCPHAVTKRIISNNNYHTIRVCGALGTMSHNPFTNRDVADNPSVEEAMWFGGARHDCPLEDVK